MKILKYIPIVLVLAFYGCNPLEETYDELDAEIEAAGSDVSFDYELTSDDYAAIQSLLNERGTEADSALADFVEAYEALNSDLVLNDFADDIFLDLYPHLDNGSAIITTYNKYLGDSDDFSHYLDAASYWFGDDDYLAGGVIDGFFNSSIDSDAIIVSQLTSGFQSSVDGDLVVASYEYADIAYDALEGSVVFTEAFETTLGDFATLSLEGDQDWAWGTFGGDTYARISGFAGGAVANQDWLVSPSIDLSGENGSITLKLDQILNFQGDSEWGTNLRIVYSTDYSGDVAAATWTGIDLDNYPAGNNYDIASGTGSMNDAAGKTINLGFYYQSTTDFAALWEIVDIAIEAGEAPSTSTINVFYKYDGSEWESIEDEVYYMGDADYDAMGNPGPGRFNNFSDDDPASSYLPDFIDSKEPFAVIGDSYTIVYRFWNGSTTLTIPEVYEYTSDGWVGTLIVTETEQYIKSEDKWNLDPTIKFTLSSDDFQIIVEEAKKDYPDLVNDFGTADDYYGADSFFINFDTRTTSKVGQSEYEGLSNEESEALVIDRVGDGLEILMSIKYSTQTPQVNGIDVFAILRAPTYNGEDGILETKLQCTDVGVWEVVEGPYVPE